jgi:hypothetical protein
MASGTTPFQHLNRFMAVIFVICVAVQYNDPDPLRWMSIYGAAAAACLWPRAHPAARFVPPAVGLAAIVWAASLAPSVLGKVSFGELFQAFEMKSTPIELGRELGGLLIVGVWMMALTVAGWRSRA